MIPHEELNDQSSLQDLETARNEWIEQARDNGFLTLCFLLATTLGTADTERIQVTRKDSTTMHTFTLMGDIEVTVFSTTGQWILEIKAFEENHSVLVGKGKWPLYNELYCNVTLSTNPNKEFEDYEFIVPGAWQELINFMYDAIHEAVSNVTDNRDEKRKNELLEQLLIGKEV